MTAAVTDVAASAHSGRGRVGQARLRSLVRRRRVPLLAAGGLAVVQSLVTLAQPWPLAFAVDSAIGHKPVPSWLGAFQGASTATLAAVAATAVVVLIVLSGVVGYWEDYLSGSAAQHLGADIRKSVFSRLLELSPRFHDAHRSGDLVTRLTIDVSDLKDGLIMGFTRLLPAGLTLIGMLVIIAYLDPTMAVAAMAVTPVLALVVVRSRGRMRTTQREYRRQQGRVAARATEVVRHARAVQAFHRHVEEVVRFSTDVDETTRTGLRQIRQEAAYGPVADTVLGVGSAIVLFLGVQQVASGAMSLGALIVILSYLGGLYSPVRTLARLSTVLSRTAASRERIVEVLGEPPGVSEPATPTPCPRPVRGLDVRGLEFSYRDGPSALQGLNLTIPVGERVCVVGPSGAGKTTLLSLLLRLYDPRRGVISLDGIDLRAFSLSDLRAHLALVPQDPWIVDGTIADNIEYGRPGATRPEIEAAGQAALVDEFTSRFPDGYDTVVGESGGMLSGGQRRRIALARAMVRDASILLLDEPTSGLDAIAESQVLQAIEQTTEGRTAVIVSHQLRVAGIADRVVVLANGQVVEEGPPAELLAAEGHFTQMWHLGGVEATGRQCGIADSLSPT